MASSESGCDPSPKKEGDRANVPPAWNDSRLGDCDRNRLCALRLDADKGSDEGLRSWNEFLKYDETTKTNSTYLRLVTIHSAASKRAHDSARNVKHGSLIGLSAIIGAILMSYLAEGVHNLPWYDLRPWLAVAIAVGMAYWLIAEWLSQQKQ